MIAGGGLSGGISSTIAGGDFWKGMRQGLITSGLNHTMHMVVDEIRVDQRLRSKGYEPNDAAKRPDFVVDNTIEDEHGRQVVGKVKITWLEKGGDFKYSTDGKVRLRSTVFNSYRTLTLTMIHELSHVIDVVSGLRGEWYRKHDAEASYHMSEVKAYQLQMD